MNRRELLAGSGIVLSAFFSGCFGADSTESRVDGYVRPDEEPVALPDDLTCDREEFERHSQGFDDEGVSWGEDDEGHFALRVNQRQFERDEVVQITLTNTSGGRRETGNRHKYNFQLETESGWHDVRGWAKGVELPYTGEVVSHDPGDEFEWEFEFSEDGLLSGHPHEGDLVVCPDLRPGRYRFAFWHDGALAVGFDFHG